MNRSILRPLFTRLRPDLRVPAELMGVPFSEGVTLPTSMRKGESWQSHFKGLSKAIRMQTSSKQTHKAQAAAPAASQSLQPAHAGIQLRISASTLFYLIAFVEGGAVMAIELAGAKMIAPFYGTSLYVWASVLAVTLGGLTTGYFLGGWASYRFQPQKLLALEVTLGALLIALMPIVGLKTMPATMDLGVRSGSLLSSALLLMPPLICMGMVSPTIIQLMNTGLKETGKTAGTVYAISTVGGIVMTLLMGFYLLPEWGIRKSVYLTAVLLGVSVLISWIGNSLLPSANSITSKKA